jgi:gamma-glutamyltranspeptidase/glutathione hydrolase
MADLLGEDYNAGRRALIGAEASMDLRPGSPGGREPRLPVFPTPGMGSDAPGISSGRAARGVGEPTVGEPVVSPDGTVRGDTCHVDVVDRHGNMVSATPSGGWLQSSPTIPGLGFCLGSRAQMFWLQDGLPASLRPGTRPRTTLSPSFALRDGKPWMAFGTPGGDQQDQWSVNFFLSIVHGGLNLQEAVDAPTFHSDHFPSSFFPRGSQPGLMHIEDRVDPGVVAELRRRGHEVEVRGPWTLGRLSAVARDGGFLKAAANPRGAQGYAAGR